MAIATLKGRQGRATVPCLCVSCKQVFYASRRDAKTCGVACRVAYHRAKNAEAAMVVSEVARKEEQQLRLARLFS